MMEILKLTIDIETAKELEKGLNKLIHQDIAFDDLDVDEQEAIIDLVNEL